MKFPPNLNVYLNLLSLVALGVVGYYAARAKVKNENIKDLITRVDILEKERIELKDSLNSERAAAAEQHLASQKAIAKLEGQVELYKDLQLESIASHLVSLDETNAQILNTLKGSAKIAADDKKAQGNGGVLVKTEEDNPLDVKPIENKEKK